MVSPEPSSGRIARLRVCLVGATHPCHNPRLLREADSLADAGHDVRVVTPSFTPHLDEIDRRHIESRNWRHQKINYLPVGVSGRAKSFFIRGRRRLASELHKRSESGLFAEYSYAAAFPELRRQACLEEADWFIAHAQAALPIAAAAAQRWKARLGFDCEDLLSEHGTDPPDIIRQIEGTYLPLCDYISAPSKGIADRLRRDYNIKPPLVLYNVFPLRLAEGMLPPAKRAFGSKVRLHWFSQTIGPGRGIEEALEALCMLGQGVELHLRGDVSRGYESSLQALAKQHQVSLVFHEQVDHDELIKAMGAFDIGLALERSEHGNYAHTVTNKIGSYLLAGLAIAATDTPGQREILHRIPSAGFLYPAGNASLLAEGLGQWIKNREALRAAQQSAWEAARNRFCWDIEKDSLLGLIEHGQENRLREIG